MFPLHYALEWGASVDLVTKLLAANPRAAGRCKGEHLPVNRAIDTALNLFTRRLLSNSVSEAHVEAFLAEGATAAAADPAEVEDAKQPERTAGSDAAAEAVAAPEVEPATTAVSDEHPEAAAAEVHEALPWAQRAFLTELFTETESILQALLEHMDEEEVVVALHCANFIQQAATIVLARALRGPVVNLRKLHLGAKTLRDRYHAGESGMIELGGAMLKNGSVEELDLSCCAPLEATERLEFSSVAIARICAEFAASAPTNFYLRSMQLPFALEIKEGNDAAPACWGEQAESISPAASTLRACLARNDELRSSVAARQRLCLASGGHQRLGSGGSSGYCGGSTLFPLPVDLLQIIGNELCKAAMMDDGASRGVLRRYVLEPDSRAMLLESVGVLGNSSGAGDSVSGGGKLVCGGTATATCERGSRSPRRKVSRTY